VEIRAREPDRAGFAEQDGHRVFYEVFGTGEPTIVLIHGMPMVHSRMWRGTVPMLAHDRRVVTIDLLGNGQSDRPTDPAAYAWPSTLGCLDAVLCATDTTSRVVVGQSAGAVVALLDAATHPDLVAGIVLLSPSAPLAPLPPDWAGFDITRFDEPPTATEGWGAVRRELLVNDYDAFARFFIDQNFPEPHATKLQEDCLGYARGTTAEVILAWLDGTGATTRDWNQSATRMRELCRQVTCPALVIHGSADTIVPVQTATLLAQTLKAQLLIAEGAGHALAKAHVQANLAIRGFLDQIAPRPAARYWSVAASRRRRLLYLSSPIGLGHASRDIAIASAVREQQPDVEIHWLAQRPVTTVLAEHHEVIHPASRYLASELDAFEQDCDEHSINAFQAFRRTDDTQLANFHIFADVLADGCYDAVIADEAWEVDLLLHDNPDLKRAPYIWLTDFVGLLPAPDGPPEDTPLIIDTNTEMVEQHRRYPGLRDRALFIGNPDDLLDTPLGPDLPTISDWARDTFTFTGYVLGAPALNDQQRQEVRTQLGYRPEEKICIVTAGGSATGHALLTRAAQAYPQAAGDCPQLRMIVVTGPRIDPDTINASPGVEVRGYVPNLARHLAVCDAAIVQGGLSTCMELAANQRPFLYLPLRRHFEQQLHVPHRLRNYRAGHRMDWDHSSPAAIATALLQQLRQPETNRPVEHDGAQRAATAIAETLW
jgi:pimeloyl-ACP methyl ester carboxylesterase/predicted glycosyltransferase